MYCAAAPASTTTRNSAACTTFCVRTTPTAPITIAAAMIPKATFSAIIPVAPARRSDGRARSLLGLDLGAELERLGLRNRLHPLAEAHLVVQQRRDVRLRVLELRAPEQRVERA